jgi:hypothetical protein
MNRCVVEMEDTGRHVGANACTDAHDSKAATTNEVFIVKLVMMERQ